MSQSRVACSARPSPLITWKPTGTPVLRCTPARGTRHGCSGTVPPWQCVQVPTLVVRAISFTKFQFYCTTCSACGDHEPATTWPVQQRTRVIGVFTLGPISPQFGSFVLRSFSLLASSWTVPRRGGRDQNGFQIARIAARHGPDCRFSPLCGPIH